MITQIPSSRELFIDERSGNISRSWYRFLQLLEQKVGLSLEFLSNVTITDADVSIDNDTQHVMASGTITITLQTAAQRDSVLSITNTGVGIITILPQAGELIQDDASKELDFQWTTVQLCPTIGGYVII
jgi:hypothetical protein